MFTGPRFVSFGCWKDTIPRVITSIEGQSSNDVMSSILTGSYLYREDAIQKCYKAAKVLGFEVFAIQDGGQCMSSAMAATEYNKEGRSLECNADGKGGPMANNVYRIIKVE